MKPRNIAIGLILCVLVISLMVSVCSATPTKQFDPHQKKLTITDDSGVKLEIAAVSIKEGVCCFEEVFEITAVTKDYTPSKGKDFKLKFKNKKGEDAKHKITTEEWFVWGDGEWRELKWDAQHKTKKIKKGETKRYKVVVTKQAELGDKRILTVPSFMGVEDERLSWWNVAWQYRVNSTLDDVPSGGYTYNLTVHSGSGTNTATDVYLQGYGATNFSDLRFTLNDTTELDYWIGDNSTDPIRVWIDVPANGIVYTYYGNSEVNTTSDLRSVGVFGDDFRDSSKWVTTSSDRFNISDNVLNLYMYGSVGTGYIYTNPAFGILANYSVQYTLNVTGCYVGAHHYSCMQTALGIPLTDNLNYSGHMVYECLAVSRFVRGYQGLTYASSDVGGIVNTNYGMRLNYHNGTGKIERWDSGYTTKHNEAIRSGGALPGMTRFVVSQRMDYGISGRLDNILIRKYRDPEPEWQTWSTPETEEFYTETSTTQHNTQRKLARTSEGYLHRVYTNFDGSNYRVYYARSTDEGSTWTETVLTDAGVNNTHPAIASDSEDNLWVAYEKEDSGIHYRKYEGLSWGTEQTISTDSGKAPVIVVDSGDTLHVVWFTGETKEQDEEDSYSCEGTFSPTFPCPYAVDENWGTFAFGVSGATVYENFTVPTNNYTTDWCFRYNFADTPGNSFSVYSWNYELGDWGILINITSNDGYAHYRTVSVPSNSLSGSVLRIKTQLHNSTAYHEGKVIWSGEAIQYSQYNGTAWSNAIHISNGAYPTIAVDTNDYIHIVWREYNLTTNISNIKHRKYTDSWQPVYNITSGETHNQTYPCIATDLSGNAHIVWQTEDHQIKSIKYESAGTWEAIKTVHDGGIYEQRNPSVSVYSDNYVYATWYGKTATYNENYIIRSSYKTTGAWSAASDILHPAGKDVVYSSLVSALYPKICSDCYTNIPDAGYAFVYDEDGTIKYYESGDLAWRCPTKYVLTIKAINTKTGADVTSFSADIGTGETKTTTNGIIKFRCLDTGYYSLKVVATEYYIYIDNIVIDATKEITVPLTAITEADYFLPKTKTVTFTVQNLWGTTKFEDVYVEAVGYNITHPEGWLGTYFGFDNVTEIYNTTQSGTTDSEGQIAFVMVDTIKYKVTFVKADAGINKTWFKYPTRDEYTIIIWAWEYPEEGTEEMRETTLNITTSTINDTHALIHVNYTDPSDLTSFVNINITRLTTFNREEVVWNYTVTNQSIVNESFVVTPYKGRSFGIKVTALHERWGEKIWEYGIKFKGLLSDLELPEKMYPIIAIALIFFIGGFFGASTALQGSLIVCIVSWIFYGIGWLSLASDVVMISALSLATVMSVLGLLMDRGRKAGVQ